MPEIPIVGQPGKILIWYPTLIFHCYCPRQDGGITLLVITGVKNPVACPLCLKLYQIEGFTADPTTGMMTPAVTMMLPKLSPTIQ